MSLSCTTTCLRAHTIKPTSLWAGFTSEGFHTSSSLGESKRRAIARKKKANNLARRAEINLHETSTKPDPVLGFVISEAGPSRSSSTSSSLWEGCKLQQTIIKAQDVWYSNPPSYEQGERPQYLLPGIGEADQQLLFGALPHTTTSLQHENAPRNDLESASAMASAMGKQSEMLMRILDLRNASKKGIEVVNRQRIVEAFGQEKGSGCSQVQAALLTHRIRMLHDHLQSNPRDTQNQTQLRLLVHERARVLKYFRTRNQQGYADLLREIGIDHRAVEGEVIVR